MRLRAWLVAGLLALPLALAMCRPFESAVEPPEDGGATDAGTTLDTGAGPDAKPPACDRDAVAPDGVPCFGQACDGNCCLQGQSEDHACHPHGYNCPSWQSNCAGKAECGDDRECCQADPDGFPSASQCRPTGACGGKIACRSSAECAADRVCTPPPPGASQRWWSCEPCTP